MNFPRLPLTTALALALISGCASPAKSQDSAQSANAASQAAETAQIKPVLDQNALNA